MLPITWRFHLKNVVWDAATLFAFSSGPWLSDVPVLYKAQVFIPWRSNSPTNFWWSLVEPSPNILLSIAQPLSSGHKQWRSWSHHHHEEDLFTVLVSRCWLTSFPGCRVCRQPLCPGKWSVHNCLTSQDNYHQLFLFADPLERGLFFPGCSLLWTREGGAGTAATVWQMTLRNRLNKW